MSVKRVSVITRPGQRVPKEIFAEGWLNDTENDPVPLSTYYSRLIDDGSLLLVKNEPKKQAKKIEG